MSRLLMLTIVLTGVLVPVGMPLVAQDHRDILDVALRDLLTETLSGTLAKEHVVRISRFHRIQGSRGYRDAGAYVLSELRRYGYDAHDAVVESFPSDGKRRYQTWPSPSGWDITSAELRMREPRDERLVGFPEIPMSVITYSDTGHVTAELVWVGSGTSDNDYAGKDVRDRIVLATGYGGAVHRLAVLKYGARAVVCFLDNDKGKDHRDLVGYTGMWPKPDEVDRVKFGFNISNRQGDMLRGLLAAGTRVVLEGWVSGTGLEPYFMDIVTARIPGSDLPTEELVLTAHLDHPKYSANDNASGSGALLDIARSLRELIDSGRLPRPRRTIRMMWVPEFYGTMAYIDAHPELAGPALGGSVLANINMDMVGANLEQLHSVLLATRNPLSCPSPLNDVVENMLVMADNMDIRTPGGSSSVFNYRIIPYLGASDHMMFIDRKIPGVMLFHGDYVAHSSDDTPDTIDPLELERCQMVAVGSLLTLANLTAPGAEDLAFLVASNGVHRLGRKGRDMRERLRSAPDSTMSGEWSECQSTLDAYLEYEQESVKGVLQFNNAPGARQVVAWANELLAGEHRSLTAALGMTATNRGARRSRPDPLPVSTDRRVPLRLTRGPLAEGLPEENLPADGSAWYRGPGGGLTANVRFEILNFIDGKRSVSAIRNLVAAEYGPMTVQVVGHYLDDLVKVKLVRWK